jgi:hypothetical protein
LRQKTQKLLHHSVSDEALFSRQRVRVGDGAKLRIGIGFNLIDLLGNQIQQGIP